MATEAFQSPISRLNEHFKSNGMMQPRWIGVVSTPCSYYCTALKVRTDQLLVISWWVPGCKGPKRCRPLLVATSNQIEGHQWELNGTM